MASDLKSVVEQSRQLWVKLTPRRRAGLLAAVALTLIIAVFASLRGHSENYSVLYSGLSDEDAGKLLEYLKAQNVPFRIGGGNVIEVPAARVHEVRIGAASTGLPRGGSAGFELFDKQTFGTTSFVERMNYQRALQGELARTIMSLDVVERARVHIAMRERSLYKDQDEAPSSSVVLTLRPGRKLSPAQVRGVVHLVASSVEGMTPDRVTIIDESGAALWTGGDESGAGMEGQQDLERTLSRRVRDMVERVVGMGHAEVVVTAELDYARTERTEELYDKDKTALRSETKSEEKSNSPDGNVGGLAGARGNLPGAPSPVATPGAAGGNSTTRTAETKNYEVNRIVNHITGPKVRLKRLHLAILVDHTGKPGALQARTAEELARIAALAKEAAGFDAERGDSIKVESAQFAVADVGIETPAVANRLPFGIPLAALYAAGGAAGLLLVLIVWGMSRRGRKRTMHNEGLPLLPISVSELEKNLPHQPTLALAGQQGARERVAAMAKADAKRAARVISSWLAEQPADHAGGRNA